MDTCNYFADNRECYCLINCASSKQDTEGPQCQQTYLIYPAGGDNCTLCQDVTCKNPKQLIIDKNIVLDQDYQVLKGIYRIC